MKYIIKIIVGVTIIVNDWSDFKMRYYVDKRENTLVSEEYLKMEYLEPELFHEFCCSDEDIVKEVWCIEGDKTIDFTYNREQIGCMILDLIRDNHFSKLNVDPIYLKSYHAPKDLYNEVLTSCGYSGE